MSGREMVYPYTLTAKLRQFPYKWTWQNSRFIRFFGYGFAVCLPVFYAISSAVNSPANVKKWEAIRAARKHDAFAPPSEHGGHGGHH